MSSKCPTNITLVTKNKIPYYQFTATAHVLFVKVMSCRIFMIT